ncbi:hypothetical protein P691DRAFT_809419 [Macrolepiota fuliginosa MF-IS2]|uniref:NACHT domain-containing protein n=1 Tax=Macrolepiota fuliginosa MF-IS2 TaxID=1400762 RepID=A0A9P5X499_9AGAR|nr:hypothetical protein P691DRAFT_809419 [Macrolepiota fuliginosa MF-IS2]
MHAVETQDVWVQNVAAQYQLYTGMNALEKMLPYVIPGAEYNSAARDPPPKCHPDTRTQIRADLQHQINDEARMIWMHGPAGVGKSAIMQTLAETLSPHRICATLFFSRSSDPPRNDSKKVFLTLAYSLAVGNSDYRKHIEERMFQDPALLERSLAEQFHRFFIAPFIDNFVEAGRQRWVMLLDGLDECRNDADDQCRIVDLIRDSILHHAGATPFVWVIASRPEDHLMNALLQVKEEFQDRSVEFWELKIPVDSDAAVQDIERYLHAEFTNIRKKHPNAFPGPTSVWPSDSDFLKVARASSGLFVFASTLTKYISIGSPASRLKLIVALIDRSTLRSTRVPQSPFSLLDMLYTQIMSDVPEDLLPVAKSLLGYFRLVSKRSISGKGLVDACNILGLYQDEAYDALRKLHSVLTCSSPEGAKRDGITFFHASFADFFLDRARSQNYYVDLDQECTNTWRCYIRILRESCQANSALTTPIPNRNGVNIYWVPEDDDSRLDVLREDLLSLAQRDCVRLLNKHGRLRGISRPPPGDRIRLLVDTPELIDAFRSIHPVLFHAKKTLAKEFMNWVNNCASEVIRETIISREFPISQLDIERLFRSLRIRPWCWYAVAYTVSYVDVTVAHIDASQRSFVKGQIRRFGTEIYPFDVVEVVSAVDAETMQPCTVRVVGMDPWGLYAVIGPFRARFGHLGDAFYVLPYTDT